MGILVPGTWTWFTAVPVLLVAGCAVFLPGAVSLLLLRLRPLAALSLAPVVSVAVLAGAGVVASLLEVRWGVAPWLVAVGLTWLVCAVLGGVIARRDVPQVHGSLAVWVAVGLASAFTVLLAVVLGSQPSPEAFPQHPDTIFHLADAQWMLREGTISSLDAGRFQSPTWRGFYPAAFHGFTATISLLTGVPVVVSSSAYVLVVAGLVWPLGCIALAVTLLGPRPAVAVSAGVLSVAFTGFPFLLMGYGVLWPNLLGQSLIPASLAAVAVAADATARETTLAERLRAGLVVMVALPALGLAHPNALLTLLLMGAALIAFRLVGGARRGWPRRGPAVAVGLVLICASVATLLGLRVLKVRSMAEAGPLGSTEDPLEAARTVLLLAADKDSPLVAASVLLVLGAVVTLRREPAARWALVALVGSLSVWWLNVAIDSTLIRSLTWPWYNNAPRFQAMSVIPSVVVATAGTAWLGERISARVASGRDGGGMRPSADRPARGLSGPGARRSTTPGVIALAVCTISLTGMIAHRDVLTRYFQPPDELSWASDTELRALRSLSTAIPTDAVVAANPWTGATYLYVVSGRRLLVPTEKTNYDGDVALLSARLDDVGDDPEVCAAAQRQRAEWAITGGRPATESESDLSPYAGVDAVGDSAAWQKERTEEPYTLYRRVDCRS
ncbi:DUF6541 family protein [Humibacillus xanthopallidus]|uniref:DUF6541 family protein n=1 Tax=Humibacillus xanthopallidus TaxID=412689 RepID=UPI00384AE077